MSKNTMIGSNVTMDGLVAVIVAKGGANSAVLSKFLSSVYGTDGYLTAEAKQAEQSGSASDFVASALKAAQNAVTPVQSTKAGVAPTPFMSSMTQVDQHVASQVAAAAA